MTGRVWAALFFVGCATTHTDEVRREPKKSAGMLPASSSTARSPAASASVTRPERWAKPIERPGLPNFHRVNDGYYRGAQPTAEGMRELGALGVKTILNLRVSHSDRDEIGDAGLAYEHIDFKAWHAEDEDVVRFLRLVTDPARKPVFVHCQHGADRTGMMTAIYRIAVDGWSKEDAILEMTQGGFEFHAVWGNLVEYVRNLDIERLKREAGLETQGK